MSRPRLALLIGGGIVMLIMLLWLAVTVAQIYASIAPTAPALATALVWGIGILAVALVGVLIYVLLGMRRASTRKRRQRQAIRTQVPRRPQDAAGVSLGALQQQARSVEDQIAQQALLKRSQEIEAQLAQGALTLVVFGTGSAGKTSIVNAILGRIAGHVGAPMGTTTEFQSYRLRLKGVDRAIHLIDTPGILEVGVSGSEREAQARQVAADATLLLFVVDNDLRQSEYQLVRSLLQMGKRLILILNKVDLYPPEEQAALSQRLYGYVQDYLAPEDLVAIAAHPAPVQLETGEQVQPDPDILPLVRRMADILRREGEDLLADNILLQSQRLTEETRRILAEQRRRQAEKVIDRFQWVSAGVLAVTPLPGVDLLAAAAVNAQMVVELGKVYGCDLDLDSGRELAVSLAKTMIGLGVLKGALEIFSLALQTNAGTFVVGRAIQGVTTAYLTRIAGKSFITYFENDQDWGDGGMSEVVQEQFQINRRDEFMRLFLREAMERVVVPISGAFSASGDRLPEEER
jgi:small GTP-binding protein